MQLVSKAYQGIVTTAGRQLGWELKHNGAMIKFDEEKPGMPKFNMVMYIHSNVRFHHFVKWLNLEPQDIQYPEGIHSESRVLEFLKDDSKPKAVQVYFGSRNRALRNLACQKDMMSFKTAVNNPDSIYSHLHRYLSSIPKHNSSDINYFLTHFYLRLSAQHYCRTNNIPLTSQLTPALKVNILTSIIDEYEENTSSEMRKLQTEQIDIERAMKDIIQRKNEIETNNESKLLWYKYGAIAITAFHIGSFGYMIFFVDWLGWDIIQPLTYTVGVVYTLMGIRFYRKFRVDRSSQTVKDTLLKVIMNPRKKIEHKVLLNRLDGEQKRLKKVRALMQVLQNRTNFQTTLVNAFK